MSSAVTRDPRFSELTDEDIKSFQSILKRGDLLTDSDDVSSYNVDWMGRYRGSGRIVLRPATTEEMSAIMRYCSKRRLAVVPQGGNTGLVGGSVPVFDEVVVSTGAMSNIDGFDEGSGIVVVESGVVLEKLEGFLNEKDFALPLDLGAKGSCMVGGNVATNAGGSRFVRYGSLRGSVVGLETVLPNGKVLEMGPLVRKDNTGYDLKQLMIGSEGTLGIITKVALACPIKSDSIQVSMLKVENFDAVRKLLGRARRELGEILSAYEFLDAEALGLAVEHLSHVTNPFSEIPQPSSFVLLIETAGSNAIHDREKLDKFLESAMEDEIVTDGVIAESDTQAAGLWELRESLPEAVLKAGKKGALKYDVSLPLDSFYKLVEDTRAKLTETGVDVVGWGHVADQNLHLNIACSGDDVGKIKGIVEPWVYEWVGKNRGSVSAEHGLGLMKADKIGYSKSDEAVELMQKIKNVVDPDGICCPYKVLPYQKNSGPNSDVDQRIAGTG